MANDPNASYPGKGSKLSPILGLPVDDELPALAAAPSPSARDEPSGPLRLTVIIPARNEEARLPDCLASLLE